MKKYVVIGDPVAHSRSPGMQNAAFAACGLGRPYDRMLVKAETFEEFVRFARQELDGFNLTVPHKSLIIPYLKTIAPAAAAAGSVNTVTVKNGEFYGDSTDGYGLETALKYTDRIAHVAYRIGSDGHLERQELPPRLHGGVMVLCDDGCGEIGDMDRLCGEVWRECVARGFGSVMADFEQSCTPDRAQFLRKLCDILMRNRRGLFVSESYGCEVDRAAVLICTAVSGGTLCQRLEEAKARFGNRVALDLQRLRMDFPLPCPGGEGCALDRETLCAFLGEKPDVFFSEDLCAKYFTRPCECELRFVLFDDAVTLRKKLHLAGNMGIGTAFLMYPEAEDILPELFSRT